MTAYETLWDFAEDHYGNVLATADEAVTWANDLIAKIDAAPVK